MTLIDKDALRIKIVNLLPNKRLELCHLTYVLEEINSAPTVDNKDVRHGRWNEVNNGFNGFGAISGRCSVCNKYSGLWTFNQPYRFCPYCGAKMDGGESDEQ